MILVSNSGRGKKLLLLEDVQTGFGLYAASCSKGTGVLH
jgi:hypothetical protein